MSRSFNIITQFIEFFFLFLLNRHRSRKDLELLIIIDDFFHLQSFERFSNINLSYSLCPVISGHFAHFTHIKRKCLSEKERKMVLSVLSSIDTFPIIITAK